MKKILLIILCVWSVGFSQNYICLSEDSYQYICDTKIEKVIDSVYGNSKHNTAEQIKKNKHIIWDALLYNFVLENKDVIEEENRKIEQKKRIE